MPFRDALQSYTALAIVLGGVIAPLVIAFMLGVMPSSSFSLPTHVSRLVPRNRSTTLPVPIKVVRSSNVSKSVMCERINVTAVRLGLKSYFTSVGAIEFIVACVLASFVVGRPVEYKYFFLEALLKGGRLRVYGVRFSASLAGAVFMALAASLVAAAPPYLLNAYPSYGGCFATCSALLLLSAVSGASFGSLAALAVRSTAGSLLAGLGFAALAAATSVKGGGLESVIAPTFVIYGGDAAIYVALLATFNVLALWRVVRIEY